MKRSERKAKQRKTDANRNGKHGKKKPDKYTREQVREMRRVKGKDAPSLSARQEKNKEEMAKKVAFWKKCSEVGKDD